MKGMLVSPIYPHVTKIKSFSNANLKNLILLKRKQHFDYLIVSHIQQYLTSQCQTKYRRFLCNKICDKSWKYCDIRFSQEF